MYQLAFSRRRDALWSARPLTCPSLVFAPEMVQYQRHPKLRAVGALRSPPAKQLVWQQAALRPCKPEWWRNQMGGQAGNSAGFWHLEPCVSFMGTWAKLTHLVEILLNWWIPPKCSFAGNLPSRCSIFSYLLEMMTMRSPAFCCMGLLGDEEGMLSPLPASMLLKWCWRSRIWQIGRDAWRMLAGYSGPWKIIVFSSLLYTSSTDSVLSRRL